MNPYYTVHDVTGVFCDAMVAGPHGGFLFGSFWGRDTALQGLLGRLSLKPGDTLGLQWLRLVRTDSEQRLPPLIESAGLRVVDGSSLDKRQGRMPRPPGFSGTLVHQMLFDATAIRPSGRAGVVFDRGTGAIPAGAFFGKVRSLTSLPLLASWQDRILQHLVDSGAIVPLPAAGLRAWWLDLGDETDLVAFTERGIRSRALPVS